MKKNLIRMSCLMVFSLTIVVPFISSAQESLLSFQDFSERVLAYYPKLKSSQNNIDTALAQQMQAKAGYWPSLNLSVGYDVSTDPVNVFSTLLHEGRFTTADFDLKRLNTPDRHQNFSSGIQMDMPLFDAMQTIYRVRSAREHVQAAQYDASFTRMEALLMAEDAYLNAVTLEQISLSVNEIWKDSDRDIQKAKDLKEKGVILGADYFAARVMQGDMARLKNELDRQKSAMMTLLNILMGNDSDQKWVLTNSIKESVTDMPSRQELVAQANASRADVAALNARFMALEADLSREKSSVLPQIHGFADAANNRDQFESAGNNHYTVGIKADMPLFDPSHHGKVKEFQNKQAQLKNDIQLYKDQISRDIAEELARYQALQDNMPIIKGIMEDAQEAVSLLVPLYDEGRKSIADLLKARQAYLQSVQVYYKSLTGVWLSQGRLMFLSGQLNDEEMKKIIEGAGL